MNRPFLTVLTPTYRRPRGLAACLASVRAQTRVTHLEHVLMVDHVGLGVAGMFAQVPRYAPLVRGQYVAWLCDDDVFAHHRVVADLEQLVDDAGEPPLLIVETVKAGRRWPDPKTWPPLAGHIDLNSAIVRGDVWHQFAAAYGDRYEGDFDHLAALAAAGVWPVFSDLLVSTGAVSRGQPEVAA